MGVPEDNCAIKASLKNSGRILLEPSHIETYPISNKVVDFILSLAQNIPGIQVFTGSFDHLVNDYGLQQVHYKEHPLNRHYTA